MPDLFSPNTPSAPKTKTAQSNDAFVPNSDTIPKPDTSTPTESHFHALASFCQNPIGVRFANQEAGERILLLLRAHFVTNVPWIFLTLFFAFLPGVLSMFFTAFPQDLGTLTLPSSYITVLLSFYYLILFAYAFISFLTWFYNVFLVTSQRVIDIDFSNVVYHQVAATKVNLVEDAHYNQIGFIPGLFDFGTIYLATASDEQIFEADNVPKPAKGVQIIENVIGEGGEATE